ncbi:MAG TPA: hypothetical protein VGB53_07295 [Rubricoccaceae bacterium]|jgi:hypothetical protein
MNPRLLAAALVVGLTTTGALCGDDAPVTVQPAASRPAAAAPAAAPKPGDAPAAGASAGSDKDGGTSAETGPAQAVSAGGLRQHSGSLETGDATLETGEFVDAYTIDVQAGQTVVVDLMSTSSLDPYLILRAPSGEQVDNDDYEGDRTRSHLEQVASESGAWRVMATSYEPGQSGTYDITIRTEGSGGTGAAPAGGK